MNFLITTIGSYGDVHPFLGIGKLLQDRGHHITFFTNPYFAHLVTKEGFTFIPVGTLEQYQAFSQHPRLFDPKLGPRIFFEQLILPILEESYLKIEAYRQNATVIISSTTFLASRLIQEKYQTPVVTVNLSPLSFRSAYEPPAVGNFSFLKNAPVSLSKLFWRLGDKFLLDPLIGKRLNSFRHNIGLPPVEHILSAWVFSPDLVIGLFPPWWASPQPDWPPNTKLASFPLFDEGTTEDLPEAVEEFLAAGEPPLVFMPGTLNTTAQDFFTESVAACERLKMRGVLLSKSPTHIPKALPPTVGYWSYIPFSQLLSRSALLIHHGGIGTTAQALRAGIPQLIRPLAFDQFDNARRIERLGVGKTILPKHYVSEVVSRMIPQLFTSQSVTSQCAELKKSLGAEDWRELIAEIEATGKSRE